MTPADPGLLAAFELGLEVVADSGFDEDDLRSEIAGEVEHFVSECVRSAPGVTHVIDEPSVSANPEPFDYVSQFAADTIAVRQHLLDLLAPLEVQLEQLKFGRGESPARG